MHIDLLNAYICFFITISWIISQTSDLIAFDFLSANGTLWLVADPRLYAGPAVNVSTFCDRRMLG